MNERVNSKLKSFLKLFLIFRKLRLLKFLWNGVTFPGIQEIVSPPTLSYSLDAKFSNRPTSFARIMKILMHGLLRNDVTISGKLRNCATSFGVVFSRYVSFKIVRNVLRGFGKIWNRVIPSKRQNLKNRWYFWSF